MRPCHESGEAFLLLNNRCFHAIINQRKNEFLFYLKLTHMKQLLFLLMVCFAIKANAQAPFANKATFRNVKPSDIQKKISNNNGDSTINLRKTNKVINVLQIANTPDKTEQAAKLQQAANDATKESKVQEKSADLFSQFGGGLVIGDDANTLFPTVNGDIITYRLGVWSNIRIKDDTKRGHKPKTGEIDSLLRIAKDSSKLDTVRHYLPLSIISKVSGSNQNNTGTVNDAVSFFGAPLTFRFSPVLYSHEFLENKIVFGMHHDLRILAIGDTNTNKITAGFGYYGAVGFTYFGNGTVSNEAEPKTVEDGVWSFSSLFYYFKSGGKFNKAVFGNYEPTSLTGIELLLRFKTTRSEANKFNLQLGANYGFTKNAPNYGKWEFKIGVAN